jgi:hypothetical protein
MLSCFLLEVGNQFSCGNRRASFSAHSANWLSIGPKKPMAFPLAISCSEMSTCQKLMAFSFIWGCLSMGTFS